MPVRITDAQRRLPERRAPPPLVLLKGTRVARPCAACWTKSGPIFCNRFEDETLDVSTRLLRDRAGPAKECQICALKRSIGRATARGLIGSFTGKTLRRV